MSLDVCSIEYKKGSASLCFHQSLLQTPPSAGPRSVAAGLEKHRASWTHAVGRPSHRRPQCRINRAMTSPRYSSPGFLDAKLTLSGHPKVMPSQETGICRASHSRRMLGAILGLEYASERAIPFASSIYDPPPQVRFHVVAQVLWSGCRGGSMAFAIHIPPVLILTAILVILSPLYLAWPEHFHRFGAFTSSTSISLNPALQPRD